MAYWYSDVIIVNYGFKHPMVPACPTMYDMGQEMEMWKRRSLTMEIEIGHAYNDLEVLERELKGAQNVLDSCNCDDALQHKVSSGKSRKGQQPVKHHDQIQGSNQPPDYERHGIRRFDVL